MREILSIIVVATLLVAAVVDVVAAGARTGVAKNHFYYAMEIGGRGDGIPGRDFSIEGRNAP